MTRPARTYAWALVALSILLPAVGLAAKPISGVDFDRLRSSQQSTLQSELRLILAGSENQIVTGPLDPFFSGPGSRWYHAVRVICPDLVSREKAVQLLLAQEGWSADSLPVRDHSYIGHHGTLLTATTDSSSSVVLVGTIQQTRFMIWSRLVYLENRAEVDAESWDQYSSAVAVYLARIDSGQVASPEPTAKTFGLPERIDLYARPPAYVIEGYQNYKDVLHQHRTITTDFATGVVAFVPSDSTLEELKSDSPSLAFPNKEAALLQHELRKFVARGGSMRQINRLTRESIDTLQAGEYFFAVGLSGTIRFGRELSRDEVTRLETERGQKLPRANHAFLFPGEPVLTAGAFFIDDRVPTRIVKVNAHSGHYFYSNVTASIRQDIAKRSDQYLLTLGHFFSALDSLGVLYHDVLISKM